MPARRSPKIEALVVNAIRRLQDVQGSSSREISNYISQEYDVPVKDISREVQLTLQRGLAYGILQRSNRGYYTCNRDYLGHLQLGNEAGDGEVTEHGRRGGCPEGRWKYIWRYIRARERRRRRRALERERRRSGSRRGRRRTTRRRGKRKRRRRGRKRRGRRRRSRTRSRRRTGERRERSRRLANLNMGIEGDGLGSEGKQ